MAEFWQLSPNASTYGADIDRMFYAIVILTGVVFVVVEVLLLWFLIRYRGREGRRAVHTHGNMRMEILWTAATAIIVVVIGVGSRGLWLEIKSPDRFPEPGISLDVTAKQFEWNVTYPGADGVLGSPDDFTARNRFNVPVGTPVHVTLRAEDVIHSFFLPELRFKQDVVPGMEIPAWFEVTTAGEYVVGCAELCGLGHYRMMGTMTALDAADWEAWYTAESVAAAQAAGTLNVASVDNEGSVR
ncbi:MAG: cytochrome c oxidase subunit II [Gemmatimonadota bacterium]